MNTTMNQKLDVKRTLIFLGFAFGIAWAVALIIYLNGGLTNSPELIPESGVTLAFVLMATVYMGSPALAHVLTRLITKEGWKNLGLRPNLRRSWKYYLAAWVLPSLLAVTGGVIYFVVFPQYFDPQLTQVRATLPENVPNPWLIVAVQALTGILAAPLINSLFTFGEEFGWRGYLVPKLLALGPRRAMVLTGIIWGIWHFPINAQGYNYGTGYPGEPWMGFLAFTWMTISMSIFLGWLTLRSGSVWTAVVGHAAINGVGALMSLFLREQTNLVIGPLANGFLGGIAWTALALWLFFSPRAFAPRQAETTTIPAEVAVQSPVSEA